MSSYHETLSSAALLPCPLVMVRIQAAQLTWLVELQSAGMPQSQSLPEDLNAVPACGQVPNAACDAPRDQMLWLAGAALEQRQKAGERANRPCGGWGPVCASVDRLAGGVFLLQHLDLHPESAVTIATAAAALFERVAFCRRLKCCSV